MYVLASNPSHLLITYDLLDSLGGRTQVYETLVDTHLIVVPGLRTLTTGRLTSGVLKNLGRETNGSLDLELLVLGARHKVRTNLL